MYKVATVGSFDGVHLGHASLVEAVCRRAEENDGIPLVITFEPHPRLVLERNSELKLLTDIEEKKILLHDLGIDEVEVVGFDREFSCLSRERFIEEYVIGKFGVDELVVGYNHRFGHGNGGDFDFLSSLGCLKVSMVGQQRYGEEKISSTIIRRLVEEGQVEHAVRLLGHPYLIVGDADEKGCIHTDGNKLLPPSGRYSCMVNGVKSVLEVEADVMHIADLCRGKAFVELCLDSRNI